MTGSFVLTQYVGHLSLGDCSVQARKIPDPAALTVLACYAGPVTASALPAVVVHPRPFSRPHCHLRNLIFADTLAAAFLSYREYSFLTPALQKLEDSGYSVPICHFCTLVWQGVPLLLVRPQSLARAPAILQSRWPLKALLLQWSVQGCRRLKGDPHTCTVSLCFMLANIIPTVRCCTLKHY